jgi:two-component system LytT family sensor kinase
MRLHLLVLNLVYWWVPALLAPVVVTLATHYQIRRGQLTKFALVHLTGAFAYSLIHTAAMLVTRGALMNWRFSRGWWFAARVEYLTQLDWMFMTYLFLVGLAHALEFRRESDRRAVDSAQLEMRLVEAQLQALQRQLHPHFLFNTLNAIAGLMRSDVDAADRMMDRLGDLLRLTLNTSNIQEVSLKEELEVLQKYLDIEQVRLGDRLTVSIDIDPEALDAQLPNFLLQPLVENAVRHGIAPHARPGHVSIAASRHGNRLAIDIADSGDGVPPHRLTLLNQGVGLANTRARLEHRYPNDHSLLCANGNPGFRVTVNIPFTVDRALPESIKVGAA